MLAQSLLTFKYVYSNFLLRIYHLLKKKNHKDTHTSCPHVAILKLHTHTTLFHLFAVQRMFLFKKLFIYREHVISH